MIHYSKINPTTNENISSGYAIDDEWFNEITYTRYKQKTNGVWSWIGSGSGDFILTNEIPAMENSVGSIPDIVSRIEYLETHAYDTLWIDFWQTVTPTPTIAGQTWFNNVDTIKAWDGTTWNIIPISFYKLYVKTTSTPYAIYYWNSLAMVIMPTLPSKEAIEALLTGTITSHNHMITVTTHADMMLLATGSDYKMFNVLVDETNNNQITRYDWDGSYLNWVITQQM